MKIFNFLNSLVLTSTILSSSANAFNNLDCLLIYDVNQEQYVKEVHPNNCNVRMAPGATFKLPIAVMAFDSDILKDEHTIYYWDGKPKMLRIWEKNHNPVSWIKESVLWYSQIIAQQLGSERINKYINDFDYGNKKMSSNIMTFWYDDSLKINAYEQVEFLKKLYFGKLPVTDYAIEKTKLITLSENDNDTIIWGKTGGDLMDRIDDRKDYYAWYVGAIKAGNKNFVFASHAKCTGKYPRKTCSATLKEDIVLPLLKNKAYLNK